MYQNRKRNYLGSGVNMLECVLLLIIGLTIKPRLAYWIILGIAVLLKIISFVINVTCKLMEK